MKKTITIIILSFISFSVFSQIVLPDTIYNIQWELLDEPSGQATSFAKSGNRIFAAPHFYSDDMGENWKRIPGYKDMDHIVASDKVVFLNDSKIFSVYRGSGSMREFRIYKSNGGNSFNLLQNRRMVFGWSNGIDNTRYDELSNLVKVNDSIFVYSKFHTFHLNAPNVPDEKLYFTKDAGTTWDSLQINTRDQISVSDDTLRIYNYNTGESLLFGDDDFTSPIIERTGSAEGMIYAKGKYFYISNDNRYLHVSSDRGNTWQKEEVPNRVYGNLIAGRLKYFDNHIYFSDTRRVYKSSVDDPFNFEEIYLSPFVNKRSAIIFDLFESIWLLNDIDGIHRSLDDGLTWERKTKGLTNFRETGFGTQGFLLAGNRFYLGSADSIRRSSPSGNTWEFLNEPFFIGHRLLDYSDGFLYAFRDADNQIVRSPDEGLTTWEDTDFTSRGFFQVTPGRIFSRDYYSEDHGLTWTNFNYQSGLTTTYQDTFLAFSNLRSENMIRHISIDKGITWESDTIWNMQMNKVGEVGDTLISFFQNRIAYSPDHGKSWIKTQEIDSLNCYTPAVCNNPILNGYVNGLIIVQSANAMHVSKNLGETWKVIKDVPFGDSLFHTLLHIDDYTEGGGKFAFKDGYLYAFKSRQGLWRTPFDPIADALPSTVSDIGEISGRVYKDLNENCVFDPSVDKPIKNKPVQFSGILTATNSEGIYHSFVPVGDYEVTAQKPDHHDKFCVPGDPVLIQVDNDIMQTVDFAYTPHSDIYDLNVWVSTIRRLRPGFQNLYTLTVKNVGTEAVISAPITFNFDLSKYEIIDNGGGVVDGGTITFYSDLEPDDCAIFKIKLRLLPTVPIGTIDIITAEVDLPNDINLSSNKMVLERIVVGSYDPNDKTAFIRSKVFPLTENEIQYLIRFQNTGTDTAFNVRVVDTIASQFNLMTLEMIDASHNYELKIDENREVVWDFKNILLPDSTINEPLSHGYIHFTIKTDSTVVDMDTLKNDAAIYFDFNEPIITNETQVEIKKGIFEEVIDYEICEGEEVNGQVFFETTTISDTIVGMIWDSIYTSSIKVNPVFFFSNDVTASPGDTLNNVIINSDTVLVENYLTAFGCDSTIITNVFILSSTKRIEKQQMSITAYPNPFIKELNFKIQSDKSSDSQIQIYDMLGRLIHQEPLKLISGENLLTIETTNFPKGSLTAKISSSEGGYERIHVLKIK